MPQGGAVLSLVCGELCHEDLETAASDSTLQNKRDLQQQMKCSPH